MLDRIPLWLKAVFLIAACALLVGLVGKLYTSYQNQLTQQYSRGLEAQKAVDQIAINELHLKMSGQLIVATAAATSVTLALSKFQNERNIADATATQKITALNRRLSDLATAGRLRDPNAGGGTNQGGSGSADANSIRQPGANSGDANPAEGAGLLSKELSQLLLVRTSEADEINQAYDSCRKDARFLRETWERFRQSQPAQ